MGVSTNGILAFGYDLGSDDEWKVEELDEDGRPTWPWYSPDSDEDDDSEFETAAMTALLAAAGFTETWEEAHARGDGSGYFSRKATAEKAIGVQIVAHCSGDYPMFILASRETSARRGYAEDVTDEIAADLTADREHLAAALVTLGITPKQPEPRWLLASLWS